MWDAASSGAAGSFASILAHNAPTAPEAADVYIPYQQLDSRSDAQLKLQEDFKKWRNLLEQVEHMSTNFGLAVKPRLNRRKDRDNCEDVEADAIMLNAELVKKHFHLPLNVAAQKIGVCTTALKL